MPNNSPVTRATSNVKHLRSRFYFVVANVVLLAIIGWLMVPERIFVFRNQETTLTLKERQFAIIMDNYHSLDDNMILLSSLHQDARYIIQPTGHVGAMLTEVRTLLNNNGLIEQDFFAGEQAFHYINGRIVTETRATLVADSINAGHIHADHIHADHNSIDCNFIAISTFLYELANHYRYIRIEQMQIEFNPTRLWLTFSIYEEQK